MKEKMLYWVEKRNHLFLGMCFCVHIFMLVLFAIIGIPGMVILNIISSIFYMTLIFWKKDFSENAIVYSYFEIIIFATVATILLGRQAGFVLYIVGMISVVFYLAYHHQNKRFLYQAIGVVMVLLLVILEPLHNKVFTSYKAIIATHSSAFYILNLLITLVTVVIVSYLYAQEINRMNHEINQINEKLDYQASHDELTGLWNRHEMNHYIEKISAVNEKQIVVAMMDVDDFKKINDQYGHGAGDLVLKEISKLIHNKLSDFKVARWGGEEFLLISEECAPDKGLSIIHQFHEKVSGLTVKYENDSFRVSLTVGIVFGNDTTKIEHMILEADNLLYIGKNKGKNCVMTFDELKSDK